MRISILLLALLLYSTAGLFAQSGMTIKSGGAVTINGNTIVVTPWNCGQPVNDTRDGRNYSTVLIGNQCWMAQNLNIGVKVNGITDQSDNGMIEKYCYNDDENNCNIYGGYYQWNEAMQYSTTSGTRGICPTGWHLPADAEWTILTTALGGESIAGGKMKESGYIHWLSPNTGATNSSGFSALAGGYRYGDGYFYDLSNVTIFWSSSPSIATLAWGRSLRYDIENAIRSDFGRTGGFSVRCLKD